MRPLNIAIFDYKVIPSNPVGGAHLRLLQGLCHEHRFTVFAVEFDNPCPERIQWVKVPAFTRPQALLFVTFRIAARVRYLFHRLKTGARFDIVQTVESNVGIGNLCYSQFCHRGYLKLYSAREASKGWRYLFRWCDHKLRALFEPSSVTHPEAIVAASKGLAGLLQTEYPSASKKIRVINNSVELEHLRSPAEFDRPAFRRQLGFEELDLVFAFMALGHFERKGLPQILEAFAQFQEPRTKLLVVGGEPDLAAYYCQRAKRMGLGDRAIFAGKQSDPRKYLWASDAFVFASSYESFSFAVLEAAAAGLPLITSKVFGVEDFVIDGVNGFLVEPGAAEIAEGLRRFCALSLVQRAAMGNEARASVQRFGLPAFLAAWNTAYRSLAERQ